MLVFICWFPPLGPWCALDSVHNQHIMDDFGFLSLLVRGGHGGISRRFEAHYYQHDVPRAFVCSGPEAAKSILSCWCWVVKMNRLMSV